MGKISGKQVADKHTSYVVRCESILSKFIFIFRDAEGEEEVNNEEEEEENKKKTNMKKKKYARRWLRLFARQRPLYAMNKRAVIVGICN
jgi:hypothetical protein